MADGQILVSSNDGVYYLKLVGDVRVTLCTSLATYIETVFSRGDAREVVVDLTRAEGADSTTLGLLAKLALYCRDSFGLLPTLLCSDPDLLSILDAMGLNELYDIRNSEADHEVLLEELRQVVSDEEEIREKVLEAHRLLIALNPDNQKEFIDLIKELESHD